MDDSETVWVEREYVGTRGNLAYWRGQDGDVSRAIADLERLLADMMRVHGANHPDTLKVQTALAHWQSESR